MKHNNNVENLTEQLFQRLQKTFSKFIKNNKETIVTSNAVQLVAITCVPLAQLFIKNYYSLIRRKYGENLNKEQFKIDCVAFLLLVIEDTTILDELEKSTTTTPKKEKTKS